MKKLLVIPLVVLMVGGLILSYGTQPAMAKEKGMYGGILKWNFAMPASRFGVPWNIRHWNHVYAGFCLESLIQFAPTGEPGVSIPHLATSWELAPDKSSYTFHLRRGVKFHDGTDFNAQAVKWNLDKWLTLDRPVLRAAKSVDVIDDYTIRVNLSSWDSLILTDFVRGLVMISPTSYEKHGEEWANNNPVGTGPFKIKEFKRNVIVKYERFEDYWQEGLPYLDGIEILQIRDPMTAIASLKKGEVLALNEVDLVSARELKATGKYDVQWIPALHQVIVMNSKNPDSYWSDKRMREALEYAIDKEAITKALGRGFVFPVNEIVHSCPGKPKKVIRKYNPEKARQLLKEAGHPKGVKVKLTHMAEGPRDFYVALQGDLAEVGIKVELNPVRGAALFQMSFEPDPGSDLRIEWQRGAPANPLMSVRETLSANSVYLPGLKRPEGFEELLQQALKETDQDKITALLERMEELAYKDVMFVPLWNKPIISVVDPAIKDANFFYGGGPSVRLEKAWLSEK